MVWLLLTLLGQRYNEKKQKYMKMDSLIFKGVWAILKLQTRQVQKELM